MRHYTQATKQECVQWPKFDARWYNVFPRGLRISHPRLIQWELFNCIWEVKLEVSSNDRSNQDKTMQEIYINQVIWCHKRPRRPDNRARIV